MNCEEFQETLFEYVEGSMSPQKRAEAQTHLEGCGTCAVAVKREKQVQQRLSAGLRQTVEALNLGIERRGQVLKICANNRESWERSWGQRFAPVWVRLAAALGAAAVIAGLAVWVWRPGVSSSVTQATSPTSVALQVSEQRPTIQIRLPGIATSYTFQQSGDFVVDAFVEHTNFVNVTLWNGDNEPVESKGKERKMPL